MAFYFNSDMVYNDYLWTTYGEDDPKISGSPDNTLLNRKEGYEVLYFINEFIVLYQLESKELGEKIERMIRNNVPSDIHSQRHIQAWIEENWNK